MNAHAPNTSEWAGTLPVEVWGTTDRGRVREGNEDTVFPHNDARTYTFEPKPEQLRQKGQLLLVADGVGGAQAGSEASRWVRRVVVERYYDSPDPNPFSALPAVIEQANAALYQYIQSTGLPDAGSTIVAAVIFQNLLYVAHVGDSRAYLIRQGKAYPLTRDHTLTELKLQRGLITPEQALADPDRGVLVRSMGAAPTVQVDVLQQPVPLAPGDVVLLCSDGLTDVLSDEDIAHFVNGRSLREMARRLIAEANRRGGPDNISVVLARVGGKAAPVPKVAREKARAAPRPRPAGSRAAPLQGFTSSQKRVLLALAVALAVVLCGLAAALAWTAYTGNRGGGGPGATATPTSALTATVLPGPGAQATATPTGEPVRPTSTPSPVPTLTSTRRPTSTPVPTPTSTPTRRPPTPTFTPTPTEPPPPPPPPPPPGGEEPPPPPPPPEGEEPPPPPPSRP